MQYAYFLLRGLRTSTAQEVIFSRAAYERSGGWVDFPLAWGSDHASQMIWATAKGLRRIEGARVLWRQSGQNISSTRGRKFKMIKVHAVMQFVEWLLQRVRENPSPSFPLPVEVFKPLTQEWFVGYLTCMHEFFGPRESFLISRFCTRTWGDSLAVNLVRMLKINLHAAYALARNGARYTVESRF